LGERGSRNNSALYDPKGVLRKLIENARNAKPSPGMVEEILLESYANIIEYAGKLRNGWLASDDYLTRYAARIIAGRSEEAVMAMNEISPNSENVVWRLVTKAKKRPAHIHIDYPVAIGLRGTARTRLVFEAALRLARETLHLIRDEYVGRTDNRALGSLLKQPIEQIEL